MRLSSFNAPILRSLKSANFKESLNRHYRVLKSEILRRLEIGNLRVLKSPVLKLVLYRSLKMGDFCRGTLKYPILKESKNRKF